MNSPITTHTLTGNTNGTSSPLTPSNNNNMDCHGQSESSSLLSITCNNEPTIDTCNKHEADISDIASLPFIDVAAVNHPNSFDRAQCTPSATIDLTEEVIEAKADTVIQHKQELQQPDTSGIPAEVAEKAYIDSASTISSSSPSKGSTVETVTEQPQHFSIKPNHEQRELSSSMPSTSTTWVKSEENENKRDTQMKTLLQQANQSIFDETTINTTTTSTTATIKTKPMSIPSINGARSSLDMHNHTSPVIGSSSFSSASPSPSSSSSLSDYLIIGQEQVERDDSECDQRSEHSYSSSRDSYGEQYGDGFLYEDISQESPSESHSRSSSPQPTLSPSSSHRRTSRSDRQSSRSFNIEEEEREKSLPPRTFSEGYVPDFEQQEQQRITGSAARASVRIEDEDEETYSSSSRSKSYSNTNRSYKRRSQKSAESSRSESSSVSPEAPSTAALPVFKLPTIRGLTKSIVELVVASVVCISLVSVMFAFSYISSGATHALGWYSDQQIGQRIRDGLRKREHVLQETLEKMAGEEYVKVKRQSRQYQQQHQTPPRSSSPPYGPGGSAYYQSRYQQQYQREREQRQQQQQQQKAHQGDADRGRLSTAEWQELIRAASVSFMAKWTTATPNPWTNRR
ncbi:hypothetical protein FBU30_005814 [Linnemannia zychae]|nr:hypothetical protein FBU30_005814 [Linnemannia zychae]